ncbi:MAG: DNA adenine methylase [Campylobacterales bacterium]|nr:DNA adenine methylase [Campylobacterales bacterium]
MERLGEYQRIPKVAPFAWVGGKSKLADKIIAHFPEHQRYCEVFGGALNVFYRKPRSKIEVVNDINSDLVNLHLQIQKRPQSLQFYLNRMFVSREIFARIKHKKLQPRNDIERAVFYYYLLTQSFGSKGMDFAMPRGSKPRIRNLDREFCVWSKRLQGVCIENMDFKKLITTYDHDDTLFYLDPPYIGTESYYKTPQGFGMNQHIELANILKTIKGKFILSYNDCEVVRDLYKDYEIIEVSTRYSLRGASQKVAKEVIIKG